MTATVVAPTTTRRRGRWLWPIVGAIVLLVGTVSALIGFTASSGDPFDPESAGPSGTKAVLAVLGREGVRVDTVDTLVDAIRSGSGEATLVVADPAGLLDDDGWARVRDLADRLVVLAPTDAALAALAPGTLASTVTGAPTLAPDCRAAGAVGAGAIAARGVGLGLEDGSAPTGFTGCYPVDDGFGLLVSEDGSTVLVGLASVFTNADAATAGNAALALRLAGANERLVWYTPTFEDVDPGFVPLGELTPGWVTPVLLLAALTAIAAAIWRGRRLGPLVVEDLPVTPRAIETTHGRARLYRSSGAVLRAADGIRLAVLARLSPALGLGRSASVDDIAAQAAAVSGLPLAEVLRLLRDDEPTTERALVRLSDDLADLERRCGLRAPGADDRTTPTPHPPTDDRIER